QGSRTADGRWADFVRRNNDELVGTWGNLVHRTLVNAYRNFGAVPNPALFTERDRRLMTEVEAGFGTVGDLLGAARFKASISEVLRLAALVNQYLGEDQPWHPLHHDRAPARTPPLVTLRCVDSLK